MRIIVCIKQVPGSTEVKINPETNTLMRESVAGIINPFDMYALEEGVRLKERFGAQLTVLSMGPPQVEESLREAISLGADDTVLLSDRSFAGADTWATSYTLGKGINKVGNYDLIICGKQAIDGDTAQVGPGIAETLDIPFVAYVRKIESMADGKIRVERMMDEGYEVVEMPLPALISVVKEINEPRLPSLKGKMRAKSAVITKYNAADIGADIQKCGLNGSPTKVAKIFTPRQRGGGEMLTVKAGEAKEAVGHLVDKLKKAGVV